MDGWMGGWMHGCMDAWIDGSIDQLVDKLLLGRQTNILTGTMFLVSLDLRRKQKNKKQNNPNNSALEQISNVMFSCKPHFSYSRAKLPKVIMFLF